MSFINSIVKALKFIIIWSIISIFILSMFALIGYVLYNSNIFIGIAFMIVLGLLVGYIGVRIKLAFEKRKRETDIDGKIQKQKFFMKMKDTKKKTVDLPTKIPEEEIPEVKKVVKKVKKKVKKEVKK